MPRPRSAVPWLLPLSLLAALGIPWAAQAESPVPHEYVAWSYDSGSVRSDLEPDLEGASVAASEIIRVENASWLRLYFHGSSLPADEIGRGSRIRITAARDGAVQVLDAQELQRWQLSSAMFNGDEVLVELLVDAGAPAARLKVRELMVGQPSVFEKSICGTVDDRVLGADPKSARIMPIGCTGWLIDDQQGCFLTAGHCLGQSFSIVQFNVPLSNSDGTVNHPPPEDQYPIDLTSIQGVSSGIGNDWAYFGAFPNGTTGLSPAEAQGGTFVLGDPPVVAAGETIRITGYGTVSGNQGTPQTWNQVQTTHSGAFVSLTGDGGSTPSLQYSVDTTGGNSGSAILNEDNGLAIGIHTHAGCNAAGGANNGTSMTHPGLLSGLANPLGICETGPPSLTVEVLDVIADPVPRGGTTFPVAILDLDGLPAVPEAVTLTYDDGSGDVTVPLTTLEGPAATHQATLPALDCGSEVTFVVEATAGGQTIDQPDGHRFRRWVADGHDVSFRDTFETDQGWTVDDDPGLAAGSWERGIPEGAGGRADPPWDGDSSGQCYLTENLIGNSDIDGGATRLVSPLMDASDSEDPHVAYWRWWSDEGSAEFDDTFVIEISDDGGSSWKLLETVGPNVTGEWVYSKFRVTDFVAATDQIQLRFTASDAGAASIVEAGVDGVALLHTETGLDCTGIVFQDGFESGDTAVWSATVN